ncbi:unnamed protein product [Phaedon cochleariae]|uniref:Fatty acyl-CoA reductase n=1 Tax=Phaedon cochleariae TaxID=80249 RepID=A0A9N9SFK7_PHACE|nr:unnamed protein product [Phaedon cochleariae]
MDLYDSIIQVAAPRKRDPLIMDTIVPDDVSGIEEADDKYCPTEIQEFYKGANVFITGSTGFLGKILLEKLLRSCPEVSTLYVLVRNKKGKNLHTRVEEIFDDAIFDRLRRKSPKFRHKVVGVAGDCSLPDLGLSVHDKKLLQDEVNIIFHVAATVRFDEKLKTAIAINVRATQDILHLASGMSRLEAVIHVSTAFANCTSKVIEEKIYPTTIDYRKLIAMSETLTDKMLDNLQPMLLDKYPNTYAYTKQVAEDVVRQCGEGLPVGIIRPSIVVSTYREPIKGWINNMYGATGVATGAGIGLIRTLHCDPDSNANIIPVDMCVNSMIAEAWDVSNRFREAKEADTAYEIPICNFESSCDNPITWKYFMFSSVQNGMRAPSAKAIWYFSFRLQKSYLLYFLTTLLIHTIPAIIVDGALLCIGKQPKMMKVYSKIHKFSSVISYFATQTWIFKSDYAQKLCHKMSDMDNEIFFSDLKKLDWEEFFNQYLFGVRTYLIKDPTDNIEEALVRWRRLYWAHITLKTVLGFLLLRLCWYILSLVFGRRCNIDMIVEDLQVSLETFSVMKPLLLTSRLFGLFPISYKRFGAYYRLKWSNIYAIYSYLLSLTLIIWTLTGMMRDMKEVAENSLRMTNTKTEFVTCCDISIVILIVCFGIITLPFKIRKFWKLMNCLNQADKMIPIKSPRKFTMASIYFLLIVISTFSILFSCDIVSWFRKLNEAGRNPFTYFREYLGFYFLYAIVIMKGVFFWHVVFLIKIKISLLNNNLLDIKHRASTNAHINAMELVGQRSLDVISTTTTLQFLSSSVTNELKFESSKTLVKEFMALTKYHEKIVEAVDIVNNSIEYGIHHKKTLNILCDLLTCELDEELKKVVTLFSLQHSYCKLKFSSCGYFKINRSLLTSVN